MAVSLKRVAQGGFLFFLVLGLAGGIGCGGGGGGEPADIRGRILLVTTGQPPNPAATVSVAGAAPVQTLADGSFLIRNASATATQIVVTAAGMKELRQDLPPLKPNSINDLGDIFLSDTGYDANVTGKVVRADTLAAVPGASVRISGKTAVTGTDGSFSIASLPAGLGGPDVQIGLIRATGFEDKALYLDFPLGSGNNDLGEIQISPPVGSIPGGPTTIRGKVTLQAQSVHTGTTVTLIRKSDGAELASVLTLEDGSFGFWVPVGSYRLRAEHTGYQTQTVDVTVTRLDEPVTVNITLTY